MIRPDHSQTTAELMTENLLHAETSPYLLQHKDNPVHWRPWGQAALDEAKTKGLPILLSVGYAACHWCHVMAHESFEDTDVAAMMNRLFINIKVDREERPDIDTIYMTALHLLGHQGGWPMTLFLTPQGEPFWGGTYFAKTPHHGQPGFIDVLQKVSKIFHDDPTRVKHSQSALTEALRKQANQKQNGELSISLLNRIGDHLYGQIDLVHGGIGSAPKFPHTANLELILRNGLRTQNTDQIKAVLKSLTHICQGGIYDHLAGGFSRYSVDQFWLVPHFEKMLYDNAQLIDTLCLAWQQSHNPLFKNRVFETIDWLKREMTVPGGGFAASLDADSEGIEGKFYIWQEDEIDQLLKAGSDLFKQVYGVTTEGNFEGKVILNRLNDPGLLDDKTENKLSAMRVVLLKTRASRIRPDLDDKALADWNGLTIAALARASFVFDQPDWLEMAETGFVFVSESMSKNNRLMHSHRLGESRHIALASDYANMIRAGLILYQISGSQNYLDTARNWIAVLDQYYQDTENAGYFMTASDCEGLIVRTRSAYDDATPNYNGIMAQNFASAFALTGELQWRDRSQQIITAFAGAAQQNFFSLASLLNGFENLARPLHVALIGPTQDEQTRKLTDVLRQTCLPALTFSLIGPDQSLPETHPAHGKTMRDNQPSAYICTGSSCLPPLTSAEDLSNKLAELLPAS